MKREEFINNARDLLAKYKDNDIVITRYEELYDQNSITINLSVIYIKEEK